MKFDGGLQFEIDSGGCRVSVAWFVSISVFCGAGLGSLRYGGIYH